MPPPLLYDTSKIDFSRVIYNIDAIRRINPQRNEMEQLTAVVHIDTEQHGIVGYKDLSDQDFWVPGHMPGFPLMPGVIMCEVAAQVASFYAQKYKLLGGDFIGFGGMEDVQFRGPVYPPARFIILARCKKLRPNRMATFDFQGLVEDRMVVSGVLTGVPLYRDHPPKSGAAE